MTVRERAIVEVHTGFCMTRPEERGEVLNYMDEVMGRTITTPELADSVVWSQLREKSLDDFKKLSMSNE